MSIEKITSLDPRDFRTVRTIAIRLYGVVKTRAAEPEGGNERVALAEIKGLLDGKEKVEDAPKN